MAERHGRPRGCQHKPVSSAHRREPTDGEAGGNDAKTESVSSGRKTVEWAGKDHTLSGNDDRHTVCPCGVMKALAFGRGPPIADHVNSVITEAGLQHLDSQDCACG